MTQSIHAQVPLISDQAIVWSQAHTSSAILCGGRGRRLGGVDKGRLMFKGEQLLTRITRLGQQLSPEVMWVRPSLSSSLSCTPPSSTTEMNHSASTPPPSDVTEVHDLSEVRGAVSGVVAALKRSSREWTWIFACDLPLLRASDLTQLIMRAQAATPTTRCVMYLDPLTDQLQPLCALWRASGAQALLEEITQQGIGLCRYARRYGEVVVFDDTVTLHLGESSLSPDVSAFFNVNEPSALETLARLELSEGALR